MSEEHHHDPGPAKWLVDNLPILPRGGRVLDVAMGTGRNAIYLAKMGFEVDGVDRDAERTAEALAAAHSVSGPA